MSIDVTRSLGTDYYLVDELLTDEERRIRDTVRAFANEEVIPIINDYWERAEFPFELIPKLAALNIAGGNLQGYGCPGMSTVAAGLIALELARGDASICTFFGVHSGLHVLDCYARFRRAEAALAAAHGAYGEDRRFWPDRAESRLRRRDARNARAA